MIALDPEFLGGFAPQSKLAGGMDPGSVPFARRPRLDRLRIQGKADDTEALSEGEYAMEGQGDTSNPPKTHRVEQEKRKMRGKGKSLKRCVEYLMCDHTVRAHLGLR
jgi:U3 small nucleolar RNA-associated protein 7